MFDDRKDYPAAFAIGAIVCIGATLLLAPPRSGAQRVRYELEPALARARKGSRRMRKEATAVSREFSKRAGRAAEAAPSAPHGSSLAATLLLAVAAFEFARRSQPTVTRQELADAAAGWLRQLQGPDSNWRPATDLPKGVALDSVVARQVRRLQSLRYDGPRWSAHVTALELSDQPQAVLFVVQSSARFDVGCPSGVRIALHGRRGTDGRPALICYNSRLFGPFRPPPHGENMTARIDLLKIAQEEQYPLFFVPPNIGGRFSVFSPVGLLPAALVGIVEIRLKSDAGDRVRKRLRRAKGARQSEWTVVDASVCDRAVKVGGDGD